MLVSVKGLQRSAWFRLIGKHLLAVGRKEPGQRSKYLPDFFWSGGVSADVGSAIREGAAIFGTTGRKPMIHMLTRHYIYKKKRSTKHGTLSTEKPCNPRADIFIPIQVSFSTTVQKILTRKYINHTNLNMEKYLSLRFIYFQVDMECFLYHRFSQQGGHAADNTCVFLLFPMHI